MIVQKDAQTFQKIADLIRELRAPGGCPWDREQTLPKIAPMLLEEVHEVLEALDQGNHEDLADELGDVIWDVVFIAVIAEDEQLFTLEDVLRRLAEKIIRRHPHVWGDEKTVDREKIRELYEVVKQKDYGHKRKSPFDGIVKTLPALSRALKTVKKAEKAALPVPLDSALEEMTKDWDASKWGEFLFQASVVARRQQVDLEQALRTYTEKYIYEHANN
ncbi:MAG: MazG nucleotide pyrophosphohydrolase domain-containing protein [bacterium]